MSRVWGIFCFPCLNNGWFISYRFSPLMCLLLLNYYTKREWRHAIEYINPLVLNLAAHLVPYLYTYLVLQDHIEFLFLFVLDWWLCIILFEIFIAKVCRVILGRSYLYWNNSIKCETWQRIHMDEKCHHRGIFN